MLKLPVVEAVSCRVCGKAHLLTSRTYVALDGHITRPFIKEGNVHYQTCIGTRDEPMIICLDESCMSALLRVHEFDFLQDPETQKTIGSIVKRVIHRDDDDRGEAL